jgi:hypothetical protein
MVRRKRGKRMRLGRMNQYTFEKNDYYRYVFVSSLYVHAAYVFCEYSFSVQTFCVVSINFVRDPFREY